MTGLAPAIDAPNKHALYNYIIIIIYLYLYIWSRAEEALDGLGPLLGREGAPRLGLLVLLDLRVSL